MKRLTTISVQMTLLALLMVATTSKAQTAEDWVNRMALASSERLKNVDIVVKRSQGQLAFGEIEGAGVCASGDCLASKKEIITLSDGEPLHVLRELTLNEVAQIAGLSVESASMKLYGIAMIMAQDALNNTIETQLGPLSGVLGGGGLSNSSSDFYNPMTMFAKGGMFAFQAGSSIDRAADSIITGAAQSQEEEDRKQAFRQNGTVGAIVGVGVRQGQNIAFNNINQVMHSDGEKEFVMESASVVIDTEYAVLLKHRVNGIAYQGRGAREFFIESTYSDFRHVPGSELFEPYKTTMRMGGVMTPSEQEQLVEAREQLAELDAQLATMTPEERSMMENMLGNQLDSLRTMANDGVIEHVQIFEAIYVNPDLKALYSAAPMDSTTNRIAAEENLVQRIQLDLIALGYEPGDIKGELTTGTVVAISQYQAERGLEVTGEASRALATALTAELQR